MAVHVTSPDGLEWRVKRLVIPKAFLPPTRHELLDLASPPRTIVEGMDRRVQDAARAPTGPIPLGFLLTPLAPPFLPPVLLFRRLRWMPWTVEARAYPWGRRFPPIVHAYAIRGGEESQAAVAELAEALTRGDGAPVLHNAEYIRQ